MVMPKNFDNPDEAFALADAWARRREQGLLGLSAEIQKTLSESTEKQNDTTK